MIQQPIIYQEGKIFRELDFQIMIRKEKIRNHQMSVMRAYKMAGLNGPKGLKGLDYSGVTSSTSIAHIGLDDAAIMIDRDKENIKILEYEISELRSKKRKLIKALSSLDGIEEQIFYRRIIMCETQESAANSIGLSSRHLQRLEKRMKENSKIFEI